MADSKDKVRGAPGAGAAHNRDRASSTLAPATNLTLQPVSITSELLDDLEPLNPKQRRFVLEYLGTASGNATEAYRRAYGAKAEVAETNGPRLLGNARVKAVIEKHQRRAEEQAVLSIERLDQELQRLALFDLGECYDEAGRLRPLHEMSEDARRAISGIKVFEEFAGAGDERMSVGEVREVKVADKVAAIALAYKRRGALVERSEVKLRGKGLVKSVHINIGTGKNPAVKGQG